MTFMRDKVVLGFVVGLLFLLALGGGTPEWLRFLVQISFATALAVLGVVLQMRAGLVSFGQGLYYCLGGYTVGMAGHFLGVTDVLLLLMLGVLVPVLVAVILGFLMARYREIFFAMLSLAFSMILYGVLVKAEVLGSTDGLNVPKITCLGFAPGGERLRYATYGLTCTVSFLVAVALRRYLSSTIGRLGDAIRENELRVEYLGASVRRAVHVKYVVAAGTSAVGGVLFAFANGHVDPEMAYWTTSGELVFIAVLSGTGSVAAPFLGAFLLELVRTYAFEYTPHMWQLILGATMFLVILFLPGGLWSLLSPRVERG